MPPAIKVSGLSKLYQVGARQQGYKTLRESLADAFWSPVNRIRKSFAQRDLSDGAAGRPNRRVAVSAATEEVRGQGSVVSSQKSEIGKSPALAPSPSPAPRLSGENFWALKDVSFEVQPGEVVGIIGRNGAGKSTLLKVLSRITEPTSGKIELRGRVGSLLEVGTGFHPELTGRENIYMNGSILGMSRREIARKFDEIVAFAEIEDFLDTPVKRYSSGMYVRLAFAVAAHLEPEILIVDEVLAVGDAEFQRKCVGRMKEVARHGRTVLFVSHSMAAIQNLCSRVIVFEQGEINYAGTTTGGVATYMRRFDSQGNAEVDLSRHPGRNPRFKPLINYARLANSQGQASREFGCGDGMEIHLLVRPDDSARGMDFRIEFIDSFGVPLFTLGTATAHGGPLPVPELRQIICNVAALPLVPGQYSINLYAGMPGIGIVDEINLAINFDVIPTDFFGTGRMIDPQFGRILTRSTWRSSPVCTTNTIS